MIRYCCDICKKEITTPKSYTLPRVEIGRISIKSSFEGEAILRDIYSVKPQSMDICDNCAKKVVSYIDSISIKDEEK